MKFPLTILLLAFAPALHAISFQGTSFKAIEVPAEASTGLDGVWVLRDARGVEILCDDGIATWSRFGASGAAYAEEIASASASIRLTGGDCGLTLAYGNRQHHYWIVDYSRHELNLDGADAADGDYGCDRVQLSLRGNADAIRYYSINGRELTLDREISVEYPTLVADRDNIGFAPSTASISLPFIAGSTHVAAPLCDTRFTISGDRFLREWGEEQHVVTAEYHAIAVDAVTAARQAERDAENEQKPGGDGLGGSAPCEIEFTAATSDAAVYTEWQLSRTPDFDILDNSFNSTDCTVTFTENGTFYVRFTAANSAGTCEYTGDTYEVAVGESKLLCPNAFTPYTTPGVNDEWRVSYQSIIEFKCDIFNRWGAKMITLTDPSQGWDGKYNGKNAGPGVYYYVIRARGADGKDYNISGDINIIGSRESNYNNQQ
ncbi:MAG: gliding motility-associated C-terminal domain-containing protein [Muribaculaceae bacterium]|nr:gliding motility-associated C-terminal domain-containing protein [Muribaculaceae bacterium]